MIPADSSGKSSAGSFIGGLRLFFQGAALSYRALFRWFRPTTYMASKILMPVAEMVFFTLIGTFGGSAPAEFFIIGNALHIAAVSGIYGVTMSIAGDRWDGTLPYLFGSPANRLLLFFGRAFVHLLDGIIGVILAFLWGVLLLGLRFSPQAVPGLFLAILSVVFSTSCLGLLMGCVGLITRNVMFVNNTVYFLLLLLSGANIPLPSLPSWVMAVSAKIPLTHGILAAREILKTGGLTKDAAVNLRKEIIIGGVFLLAGYILFRIFERIAKRKGSLETV